MAIATPAIIKEARPIHELAIPLTNNDTNSIRKPDMGGQFELKQNIMLLLHMSRQFTGLSHEDPQQHIRNFLEITNTYIPTRIST